MHPKEWLKMKIEQIYDIIEEEGFTAQTLQTIDNYIKEIQNGTEDFPRFNLSEHAGFCTAGAPLIGASIIASYATASITASCNAEGSQGGPANWQIDEYQEKLIEQWARAANLWEDEGNPRYYLHDCYPTQFINDERTQANNKKNAVQWETFTKYLESKGKLKK